MEHSGACLLGASFMFVCASTCWYYLGRSSGWGVRRCFHCDQAGASLFLPLICFSPLFRLFSINLTSSEHGGFLSEWAPESLFSGKVMTAVLRALSKLFFSICILTFRIYKHGIFGTESFLISSCSLPVVRYLVVCWLHLQKYNHQAIWYPLNIT